MFFNHIQFLIIKTLMIFQSYKGGNTERFGKFRCSKFLYPYKTAENYLPVINFIILKNSLEKEK